MDIDQLRAWVRDELGPADRRAVTRWMIRNTDPTVPGLLTALIREWEEERADEALLARRPAATRLVEAWKWLLDLGGAGLALPPGTPAGLGLMAATTANPDPLVARPLDDAPDQVDLEVWLAKDHWMALFATPDGGEAVTVVAPAARSAGPQPPIRYAADPQDERTTFWLFVGTFPPPGDVDRALLLARSGGLEVHAIRWWPEV